MEQVRDEYRAKTWRCTDRTESYQVIPIMPGRIIKYSLMPGIQRREEEQENPKNKRDRDNPQKRPGQELPEIGEIDDLLERIDEVIKQQPDPKDYRQPGGQ